MTDRTDRRTDRSLEEKRKQTSKGREQHTINASNNENKKNAVEALIHLFGSVEALERVYTSKYVKLNYEGIMTYFKANNILTSQGKNNWRANQLKRDIIEPLIKKQIEL